MNATGPGGTQRDEMTELSLYAILRSDDTYFAGFDPVKSVPMTSTTISGAKLFSNKFDINLRPDELMVQVNIPLIEDQLKVSVPFKPKRRSDRFPPDRYHPTDDNTNQVTRGKRITD